MSLTAGCARDSITVGRLVTSTGLAGGSSRSFTSGIGRGSLGTSYDCRIQEISADTRAEYGIKGNRRAWKLLFVSNPSLTEEDHVFFTNNDGDDFEARIIKPSRDIDNQGRIWAAVVEHVSTMD